jgi:hypothetical protein
MSPEEQVRSALQALAEHDRSLESATSAEALFAQRRVSKQPRWMWFGVVAAAAAAAVAVWNYQPAPHQKIRIEVNAAPEPPQEIEQTVAAVLPPPPARTASTRRPKRAAPPPPEPPEEIVTEFFPLMDAPPPTERGQIVRMVVPASTMRTVGLPIAPERWNDRVQADVLVGEEGMARAIRFVSFTQ